MFNGIDDLWMTALAPSFVVIGLSLIATSIAPRPTPRSRALMLFVSAAFMAKYAWWRTTQTLPAASFSAEYAIAIIFLGVE